MAPAPSVVDTHTPASTDGLLGDLVNLVTDLPKTEVACNLPLPASTASTMSLGDYLIQRLSEAGARHVFGVPGDYALGFFKALEASPLITYVGTTCEAGAAFAADGYARCQGIGVVAVTYGPGALSVVNAVAGANAEHSAVVVISGAPAAEPRDADALIHHKFGPFDFQRQIFQRLTAAQAVLDDPLTAARAIDTALAAAATHRRPVYIELPQDMVATKVACPGAQLPLPAPTRAPAHVEEAAEEVVALLSAAKRPVVLLGQLLHRSMYTTEEACALVAQLGLPYAATLTGKSVVPERGAEGYLGVYAGALGSEEAAREVESADLLLVLGMELTDFDLGLHTAAFGPAAEARAASPDPHQRGSKPPTVVRATFTEVHVRGAVYRGVPLLAFLTALLKCHSPGGAHLGGKRVRPLPLVKGPTASGFPAAGSDMTVARLVGRINDGLTKDMTIVADVGDCLFASISLQVHEREAYLASAYYTTMGFATPAALGASVAHPTRRALVLVGDGAFQMTGLELSTHARLSLGTIVIIFNNGGYSTERFILEGAFNDIAAWKYHRVGELIGGNVKGYEIRTEEEFETAWGESVAEAKRVSVLSVTLAVADASPAMKGLAARLGLTV